MLQLPQPQLTQHHILILMCRLDSSTSTSETTTDGVTTRTDTVTTTETGNYETTYDYAAESTRLWDIYTAKNA